MSDPETRLSPMARSVSNFLNDAGWGAETQEGLLTYIGGTTTDVMELGYICTLAPESDQVLVSVVFELAIPEIYHHELLMLLNEINKGSIPGAASYHFDDEMVELCSSILISGIEDLDENSIEEIAIESFAQVHEILIGVSLAAHMAITELISGVGYSEAMEIFTSAVDTFIATLDLDLDQEV